jgi:hypothetical protein
MSKGIVVLSNGFSTQMLENVFLTFNQVRPLVILDGIVAIVDVPVDLVAAIANLPGLATVSLGTIAGLDLLPIPLIARPWLEAWNRLFDPVFVNILNTRSALWLTETVHCPDPPSGFAQPPQTMTMTDTVVIVNGPLGSVAQISPSEDADIAFALIYGFDILYRNAPSTAKLVFVVETQRVSLSLAPTLVAAPVPGQLSFTDHENRESLWRNPALQSLGLSSGFNGISEYRTKLIQRQWVTGTPQKSIVGFFTKYNTAWFGYAGSGRFVIQFPWAKTVVGSDNLDRVTAHEICHLFNAPDEYGSCNPLATFGPFNVLNGNCLNNPLPVIPHVPCLMAGESDDMCAWTKAHLGWLPFP